MLLQAVSVFTCVYIYIIFTKTQSCEPEGVTFRGKPMSFGEMNILVYSLCHFHHGGLWEGGS